MGIGKAVTFRVAERRAGLTATTATKVPRTGAEDLKLLGTAPGGTGRVRVVPQDSQPSPGPGDSDSQTSTTDRSGEDNVG